MQVQVQPSDPSGGQFGLIYGSSDTVHISSRFGHLEGIDYDTEETPALLNQRRQEETQAAEGSCSSSKRTMDSALQVACLLFIGACCAGIGIGVHSSIFRLLHVRNAMTAKLMYSGEWLYAFFSHTSIALAFTLVAFLAVWCEFTASGSGIPEVKALLNGVNLRAAFRVRTLAVKATSVIFAVSSGLFVGPDGPMIHMCAIVGVIISKFFDSLKFEKSLARNSSICDFATFGAAAAIAASFRAPFGGVLFAVEEAASRWSARVVSRAFLCAAVTYLIVVVVDKLRIRNATDSEEISSNFSFGHFSQSYAGHMDYQMLELVLFMLVGIAGGVLGAVFVLANSALGRFRRRFIGDSLGNRFAEIMIVSMFTAWFTFTLPIIWSVCTTVPDSADTYLSNDERILVSKLVQYNCPHGSYNQAASLLFVDSNVAVQMMFHLREHMAVQTFSVDTLLIVFFPYFVFAMYTVGVTASVGAFIPLLMSGALVGRIIGAGLIIVFPDTVADSGTYALVGAAAMLGGACRSVAAITVILMETTGNLQFALPLMISLVTARIVGDSISDGLYISICAAREYICLPEKLDMLCVKECMLTEDFMTRRVTTLPKVASVSEIIRVLKTTTHNLFPIVAASTKALVGTVTRPDLITLLLRDSRGASLLSQEAMYRLKGRVDADYDRKLIDSIDAVVLDGAQEFALESIADVAPYTVFRSASIQRSYRLFTSLGLRQLLVVNENLKVVGILTRADFLKGGTVVADSNEVVNPMVQPKGESYKRIVDRELEEDNFEMNPYISNDSKNTRTNIGSRTEDVAEMYPAGVISTYKKKGKHGSQ